ncbi:MAG: hypothetical protein QW209_06550 [Nitrososphaerota archaeon]
MEQIRKLLNEKGQVTVADVVKELEVSPMYAKSLLSLAPNFLKDCVFDHETSSLKKR